MSGARPETSSHVTGASSGPGRLTLSVDAMGGDQGPQAVTQGLARFMAETPAARALLHGPQAVLDPLIARHGLAARVQVVPAAGQVAMTDKPSHVMRHGKDTSMWSAIDAVRDGRAQVCVSCGNTGALMAVAMLRLRKAEGVNRPAIACLWPSGNPAGFNVMLDAGADIRADQDDLLAYALMGAAYAREGLGVARPRIGLLNVGTEEHKGRAELRVAQDLIARAAQRGDFDYVGFVEGGDLPSTRVDVIVTDGFTGNVALKTGEGTARLIATQMREALNGSMVSRIGALLAMSSLRRFQGRIDPRRVNGGVFLGLNGTVIKSHGSADATGIAAALHLAWQLASTGFTEKVAARVAAAVAIAQDALGEGAARSGPDKAAEGQH